MTNQATQQQTNPLEENFATLLEESLVERKGFENTVIEGTVIAIQSDTVLVDVGLKSEGRIPIREFHDPVHPERSQLKIGDKVEVFVERIEDKNGEIMLSREKAKREEAWKTLEKAHQDSKRVDGVIFGRVKGGFAVDLGGAVAFLPGSQVDIRPIRDVNPLIGQTQPFQILKMDRARGNIVVSRRAVMEENRAESRSELISTLKEGAVLQGVVKNITDYGAFVDLGGVDGLLHITDISWQRINHPSEILQLGQPIQVKIIKFDENSGRVSLGMKQLSNDPWQDMEQTFKIGERCTGRITNITDYGAFVELRPGIEGLIHVTEMSWTKKNAQPGKIVSTSQEVEVMVLDIDPAKRRISLGLKQCTENPWQTFAEQHKVGDELEGEVKNVTEFGVFVGLSNDVDGMVHSNDLSWADDNEQILKQFKKGQVVRVKILEIDVEKERVALGIKQLTAQPTQETIAVKKGDIVTCTITALDDKGLAVKIADDVDGFIKKSDLSMERSEQRVDRFAVGEKVDGKVLSVDKKTRVVNISIKAHELEEEKKAIEEFGSTDSGASLGDILGAAIAKQTETKEKKPTKKKESETSE